MEWAAKSVNFYVTLELGMRGITEPHIRKRDIANVRIANYVINNDCRRPCAELTGSGALILAHELFEAARRDIEREATSPFEHC